MLVRNQWTFQARTKMGTIFSKFSMEKLSGKTDKNKSQKSPKKLSPKYYLIVGNIYAEAEFIPRLTT